MSVATADNKSDPKDKVLNRSDPWDEFVRDCLLPVAQERFRDRDVVPMSFVKPSRSKKAVSKEVTHTYTAGPPVPLRMADWKTTECQQLIALFRNGGLSSKSLSVLFTGGCPVC